uniref:Uncharacterized protein n=1 Tax=Oryza rufipogon TaxID=4529 RepID=A0A0E0R6R9_ORYRU
MVSIAGFGGLGKTTLAKQVYQKIKWQFDCAAFVFVSQMPDMKRILLDLLSGLGASGNRDDERQLIDKIREFLHDKSRIITTTRILDIAALCCSTFKGSIYRLEPLSESDSRRCNRLDQVAESYFNELINRSMILPVSIAYDGSIQICQVHDLVLNIIISMSKEDNFVTVIDGQKCSSLPEKIHRLSLQFNDSEDAVIPANITNKNSVRSISVFGSTKQKLVCLYVSTKARLPERIGTMQSLEELFHISSNSIRFVEDLKCLTKLRDLAISVEDPVGTEGYKLRCREAVLSSLTELG